MTLTEEIQKRKLKTDLNKVTQAFKDLNPNEAPSNTMPATNYDRATAEADDEGAFGNARDVKLPFNKDDIKLWFSLIESKMQFAGLKRQWSKRQVLVQLIPPEYHTDFKNYLQMREAEAGNLAYFDLKAAIVKPWSRVSKAPPPRNMTPLQKHI